MEVIHNDPDGVNINVRSGATAPAALAAEVVARGADVGFALDGDADRLIAVDATGAVVDGDQVLGILALDRLARGVLPSGGLVVSVLSNGGLQAVVEAAGGHVIRTPVGDKYILEGMQVSGATLGGEKSGHVIVLEHTTSGDGVVTALEVLRVMARQGAPLRDLAARIPLLPQQQRAVPARHRDQWEGDQVLQSAIRDAKAEPRSGWPDPGPPIGHGTGAAGDGRRHRRTTCRRTGRSLGHSGRRTTKLTRPPACLRGVREETRPGCAGSSATPVPARRGPSSSRG